MEYSKIVLITICFFSIKTLIKMEFVYNRFIERGEFIERNVI